MIRRNFSSGGYVIHGITGPFVGRCSAWFAADGCMLDAEQIIQAGKPTRDVKRGGPLWEYCKKAGARCTTT